MSQLKDSQAEKEFFVIRLFILFKPWNDWMSPTHNGEDNLLYSHSCSFSKKTTDWVVY